MGRTSKDLAEWLWPDGLQELQDRLSQASAVPILVVDSSGRPLTACEDLSQFCRGLTRAVAISRPCLECGRGSEAQPPRSQASALRREPALHVCPLGMVDATAPVFCAGEGLGHVISAQAVLAGAGGRREARPARRADDASEEPLALLGHLPRAERAEMARAASGIAAAAWLLGGLTSARKRNLRLSERLRAESRSLRELAVTDAITGAANKRRFVEGLRAEIERARRYGRNVSLVVLEVEDLNAINEEFGHDVGDGVLASVAHCLHAALRQTDLVGRCSGAQFGLLLPETARHQALVAVERVLGAIEDLNASGELPVEVRVAAGIVDHVSEAAEMLEAAREAAKRAYGIGGAVGWAARAAPT